MSEMEERIKELEERVEVLEDLISNMFSDDLIEKQKL